jgi:hypothetical protein
MRQPVRSKVNRLLVAALAATPMMACAASGEFTFVVGDVSLTKPNGQRVTPARGTPVDAGDRIATGTNGMAQLTMVDNARLSLRPSTQFQIEAYPDKRDSADGAVLSLFKGTLRTFTGLLASTNRDKFVMKTRVATVGIRGSGNILYACEGQECDESVATGAQALAGVTVNHTIEGSHAVANVLAEARPGVPAQQGGVSTLISGPGQTVLVAGNQPPRYIPTPQFISDAAISMTAAKPAAPAASSAAGGDTRNFSPSDVPALPVSQRTNTPLVGNNGLGFVNDIDARGNLGFDPNRLQDIVIVAGSPFLGQATTNQLDDTNGEFRGYTAYAGSQSGIQPAITGGTARDGHAEFINGASISMGRYENAGLGIFGPGSATTLPGSIHWIVAPSGFPTYLSDVLTGSTSYTLVSATAPTNQNNTVGTLGSATLFINFTNRSMGIDARVTMPAAGSNPGGSWTLSTPTAVPFAFNTFFASTADNLLISNGTASSSSSTNLTGSVEGSFVGAGLGAAILGYGISDRTSGNSANWNFVSGVAAFRGERLDESTPYREGRVSDPNNTLVNFIRSYSTTNRPAEVVSDSTGRVTAFSAPYQGFGPHADYAIGTAQVVQSGAAGDDESGLVWGRWSGGTATVSRNGQSFNIPLGSASLHYIFAATQSGPVQLPLTGTAAYDVIGSTSPTNSNGQVGTLGSAALNANFTNRTVDANVNISIANQAWAAGATGMPIYREQYFSAYTGNPIPGIPNPTPLQMTCSPNCGQGASGSIDGFFTGRTGGRAGMMYNLGGNQGAIAFGRRPGG